MKFREILLRRYEYEVDKFCTRIPTTLSNTILKIRTETKWTSRISIYQVEHITYFLIPDKKYP